MPKKSVVLLWKKTKQRVEQVEAESVEVVSERVTWRVVTNSGELIEGLKAIRREEKAKTTSRGVKKKMGGVG